VTEFDQASELVVKAAVLQPVRSHEFFGRVLSEVEI